jgi:hypothetical protein
MVAIENKDASIAALIKFAASSRESERNSRLFWTACKMFDLGLGIIQVSEALLAPMCNTGLDEREILRTIQSASNLKYRRPID